ncbi:hypothetical protein AU255_15900 [Methyloprofundus sedimenti]|uniref:Large ribosomal RNA subunit accumulation protein YceD n=1 Tax=Methyloprofundus sedimenti TaxID=1420851 RepID=A0A1V8M2H9_9GAMM|nr:YceD family protein [Methyloprofundus sedimenti]OQK15696.1 hypothetical protein AU255_15900 [Methyloprofundus sedimenti]
MRIKLTESIYTGYYYTFMSDQLPEFIDPVVFAERQSHVHGRLGLQRLGRLVDILFDKKGELKVDLQFYKEGKVPVIEGRIEGHITLICQSCMEALDWLVDKPVKIGMVQTIEQADRLVDGLEPLMIADEKISLPEFIEDEVLISLPDYPRHTHKCLQYEPAVKLAEPKKIKQESDNPFSVLAKLKITGDQ